MSQKLVRALLESRLTAWAKARTPQIRIAYQNVTFTPQTNETYLAAYLLPASTTSITLEASDKVFSGVFQVSIVAPSGNGPGVAESIADELELLFPNALRLTRDALDLITMSPVETGPLLVGETTVTVPASFQYRADID
jgi:hypothetical protein